MASGSPSATARSYHWRANVKFAGTLQSVFVQLAEMGHRSRQAEAGRFDIQVAGGRQILRNPSTLLVEFAEPVHRGGAAKSGSLLVPDLGGVQIDVAVRPILVPTAKLVHGLRAATVGGLLVPALGGCQICRNAAAKFEHHSKLGHGAAMATNRSVEKELNRLPVSAAGRQRPAQAEHQFRIVPFCVERGAAGCDDRIRIACRGRCAGLKSDNVDRSFASGRLLRLSAAHQRDGAQSDQSDCLSDVHPGGLRQRDDLWELDGSITRFRRSSVRIMTEPRLIWRGAGDAYRTLRAPDTFLQPSINQRKRRSNRQRRAVWGGAHERQAIRIPYRGRYRGSLADIVCGAARKRLHPRLSERSPPSARAPWKASWSAQSWSARRSP